MVTDDGRSFQFEDCLLKHHIRTAAWLPLCKSRLKELQQGRTQKNRRRLRYFTFCAVGAIDVLMLDIARVIRKSQEGRFDTVYFFEKSPDLVDMVSKRIPGAIGFPGDFTDIVLADDPHGEDDVSVGEVLEADPTLEDTASTRKRQVMLATRRGFVQSFPFDVINLDLEGYLLRPTDQLPGKLINALRKVFGWQRRKIQDRQVTHPEKLLGFSLMLTTKIGPRNLTEDYLGMLRQYLQANISSRPSLSDLLKVRTGGTVDLNRIESENFDMFFRLAAPKLLTAILHEEDWFIDPIEGIKIYQFERPTASDGPYKMLHVTMHVMRKTPPVDQRAPGVDSSVAQAAYGSVVEKLFSEPEIMVQESLIDVEGLRANLERIKEHRRKIYPEGE